MMRNCFFVAVLLLTILAGCSTPTPAATPTPPPVISAVALLQEREANATRFDDTYKDQWVTVYGTVSEIDDGAVTLVVGGLLFKNVVKLNDLPRDQQAAADRGQVFQATCKVGSFVDLLGATMSMNDCHSGKVVR